MIEYEDGQVVAFWCDECEDSFEPKSVDFHEALAEAKRNGWVSVKDNETGEWKHFCKDCAP